MVRVSSSTLVANVKTTAQTTCEVLDQFEISLRRGGFDAGADSYLKLAKMLASQRLWSRNQPQDPAGPDFRAVAERASRVLGLLEPFVASMRLLSGLETVTDSGLGEKSAAHGPQALVTELEAAICDVLSEAKRPMSETSLRTRLGVGRRELKVTLEGLASQGRIEQRRQGARVLFSLAQA
jgi:hypothetical protein